LDLKKYKKAEKNFLKAIELKPDMVDSHFYLGVIYEQTEKFEKAIPYFKKTIELESKNSNALNYLGYSFADRGINLDEAETLIKKALEIEPDNGAYMDSLGWTYFKKKDYINARLYLEKAASKLNDPVIFEHLGELEEVSGNNTGALDYYKKALKLDTKNKSYQNKIKLIEKKN
ncbi:MAG: tetratricopeptide repeat protein, partial [Elusimicrobiota bacterium]